MDGLMHSVRRLAQLDFNVPGVKPVGMELMKILNGPEPDIEAMARVVELDPALFGSILACANSPLYGGVKEIVDLRMALIRLGMKEIRRIVFHVVLDSAFRSDHQDINKFLRSIWRQNLAVSLTMQQLLQHCPQVRALPVDMVAMIYPLGLMHLIGIPVLIVNFFDRFTLFVRDDLKQPLPEIYLREKEIFDGFDHFILGRILVDRWGFPEFFPAVLESYHLPEPTLEEHVRILHSLLRMSRHLTETMGCAALSNAPEGFWLQGNCLDLTEVDTVELTRVVLEQMDTVSSMFA